MCKISRLCLIVLICLALPVEAWSQQLKVEWVKMFGSAGADTAADVLQTYPDRGYIIAGSTDSSSAGEYDMLLIKTDSSGNILWEKTFGGSLSDYGTSVQQTKDGGYIIAGATRSYSVGNRDVWLIKTDKDGNQLWDKTFGGAGYDYGRSVQQTRDEGYIVLGYTESFGAGLDDVWLIKTDKDGNEVWNKTFGGPINDYGRMVRQTTDGGYIIIGETASFASSLGKYDLWLIKTDRDGNELWNKTFGGTGDDRGHYVLQTADGYILTGYTESYGAGNYDVWLIKTDHNGNELWSKTFGGTSNDRGRTVQQTTDGGFLIAGYTASFSPFGLDDIWLIKTDVNGNKQWDRIFGGPSSYDSAACARQTADGQIIIVGSTHLVQTESQILLIKAPMRQ